MEAALIIGAVVAGIGLVTLGLRMAYRAQRERNTPTQLVPVDDARTFAQGDRVRVGAEADEMFVGPYDWSAPRQRSLRLVEGGRS